MLSRFSRVQLFATLWTVAHTRLLCPWDSPGKNTRVGCRALLWGIFLTQGSNLCLMSPALAGRFFTASATRRAPTKVSWTFKIRQQAEFNHHMQMFWTHWILKKVSCEKPDRTKEKEMMTKTFIHFEFYLISDLCSIKKEQKFCSPFQTQDPNFAPVLLGQLHSWSLKHHFYEEIRFKL